MFIGIIMFSLVNTCLVEPSTKTSHLKILDILRNSIFQWYIIVFRTFIKSFLHFDVNFKLVVGFMKYRDINSETL